MVGRDTVELALGAVAGVLLVLVGFGATIGDVEPTSLGLADIALVAVVAVAVLRRRRGRVR